LSRETPPQPHRLRRTCPYVPNPHADTGRGDSLDDVVIEEGVSGSVPVAERPAAGPLFAKLKKGDVVIAPKLDRLFRSALDALRVVEELRARGVRLHLLDLGGDIAGNGLSKLFLTIAAGFAEVERDRIRERIGQVKADQKARGRYLGGKVASGRTGVRCRSRHSIASAE